MATEVRQSFSPRRRGTGPRRAAEFTPAVLLEALASLKRGDFSIRLPEHWTGVEGKIADTFNEVVSLNRRMAGELARIGRVVGKEGKIGERATIGDVEGAWAAAIDSVNTLIGDLSEPTSESSRVLGAVAKGDLSQTMSLAIDGRPLRGQFRRTAQTVNTMVDQLRSFASEVTRVAREVGTEGKLGGQASVPGVAGTWKDLTDSVNSMASNLTAQVRNIAEVTTAVARGDLTRKITVDVRGEILELKDTINTMVDQLRSFASEVTRVAREVGTEGKLGGQANVAGVAGTWKDLTESVNSMASNLTAQVRNIAAVTTAVARGDLSRKITVDVKGEILELKNTINTMVDQLSAFASEVTRVAREVGTEGNLGGQASVPGVSGTWKDLTDNVNSMASNLTSQVRGIAKVVTAVANGDLGQNLTVEAKGEIAALAETINAMISTLAIFADQVTTVAREVGVEGKLGNQASVPGAAGTWKDLTDNVNRLAANLTTQVRAIAEVATAVTEGDLTRSIQVEALGEVAALKDNINEMIHNLRETTRKNAEQDWLKTNLAKFSRMLQGQRDLLTVGRLILSELAPVVSAQQGVIYTLENGEHGRFLRQLAAYGATARSAVFSDGEGLVGQCAVENKKILLERVPADYLLISSGLGEAAPANVIVLPVPFEGQVKAVLELASFESFSTAHQAFLEELMESIGIVLHTIQANTRTEDLLLQSQSLAGELQSQQEALRQTNQELEEKAALLAMRNADVERKNQEVEQARQALEEKAKQLALTSKYKSEFLANMSHELRTPLNSLLILSDQLSRNQDGNLSPKETEFAHTIHSAATDLLHLINDILDLSKIESGTVTIDLGELTFSDLGDYVERTFRHVAEAKGLGFEIVLDPTLPRGIVTDSKRLQQILKNMLSNAFKFTERGRVTLAVQRAAFGWSPDNESLARARAVVAFEVTDSGIGIPLDKQQIIFEAFQQADGTTSRRYGGTGLGLAISREIAHLLGGEIALRSNPGEGSVFTLYLPQTYAAPRGRAAGAQVVARPVTANPLSHPVEPLAAEPEPAPPPVPDDRAELQEGDRTLLIVDNDEHFAAYLLDLARELGFKGVVATRGASAVALARELRPHAITLDVRLPDVSGWRVLDRLKNDPETRHIPVYVVSAADDVLRGIRRGAAGILRKPVESRADLERTLGEIRARLDGAEKRVLLIAAKERQQEVVELLPQDRVERVLIEPENALAAVGDCRFDLVIVVLDGESATAELLEPLVRRCEDQSRPVLVYMAENLSPVLQALVERLAQTSVLTAVDRPQRLAERAALHLHLRNGHPAADASEVLAGRRALIVDDDIRNIFALTSVLERHSMAVASAETGQEALSLLSGLPDIDIVLMDIMMPGMDGYETMRQIRRIARFRELPIVAVTARAMKGDREKTIEAGAWDYLAKPIDSDQLVAVLRAWLTA